MTSTDVEASEHVWSVEPTPVSVADLSEDTWSLLRDEAMRAMRFAYVPYSSYPVGAAALVDDGRIVSGANIENASFGVTLCAECSLVSDLFMSGGGRIVAFDCVDGAGQTLVPCGRCRQLLFEHGGNEMMVNMPSGKNPMSTVLPEAFGPDHLSTDGQGAGSAKH